MRPHSPAAERPSLASASAVCATCLRVASHSALRSSSVGPASRAFSLWSNSLRFVLMTEPLFALLHFTR
jgi:hypothetical protein